MRTILQRLTVGLSLLVISALPGETKSMGEHPLKQYVQEHIMPVMLQKRQEFDLNLNGTERAELADYREQLLTLRKDFHRGWNRQAENGEEATPGANDEQRQANFKKMQDIMTQVKNIADRHKDELDKIFDGLAPQRQQWKEDIAGMMAAKKEMQAANSSSNMDIHVGYMHNMVGFVNKHSRTMFLLLNPSNVTSMSNMKQAPLENISPMVDEDNVTIYPNPAATEFTLNVAGVTTIEKMVVTDMTGKMIVTKENVSPNETFPCGNLSNGVYLLQLYTGGQATTQKLVVSH